MTFFAPADPFDPEYEDVMDGWLDNGFTGFKAHFASVEPVGSLMLKMDVWQGKMWLTKSPEYSLIPNPTLMFSFYGSNDLHQQYLDRKWTEREKEGETQKRATRPKSSLEQRQKKWSLWIMGFLLNCSSSHPLILIR